MIAVDTNVLARLLVADDDTQADIARRFISRHDSNDPLFVSAVVVIELAWLLGSRYRFPHLAICAALNGLFMSANLVFENEEAVRGAVQIAEQNNADIADAIIAAIAALEGCTTTVTFDKTAATRVPGMELLT